MPVAMQDVSSSAIRAIGYDTESQDLYIEFSKPLGQYPTYLWPGISEDLFIGFLEASSKGEYYHNYIKLGAFGAGQGMSGKLAEAVASKISNMAETALSSTPHGAAVVVGYKVAKYFGKKATNRELMEKVVVGGSLVAGEVQRRTED